MKILMKKVLVIVEADHVLRKFLAETFAMLLPRDEWDVCELGVDAGVDITLERTPNIYCAIITYNNTRQMGCDGLALIACVRKSFPHTPIIVIHELEPDYIEKATRAGANALIYKGDVTISLLKQALETLMVLP